MAEEMEKSGTATFLQRFERTQRLEEMVRPFLEESGIIMSDYGQNYILGHNGSLEAFLKKRTSKKSPAALMVKFSPDFVCYAKENDLLFFADTKSSLTPVLFDSKLEQIKAESGRAVITREQVGLVEREAWDNYNLRYPPEKMAIIMTCPYHPRLLLMEWAANIQPLFRFQEDVNEKAAGSGTPHVNLDLDTMRTMEEFLTQEFSIPVEAEYYGMMIDYVKSWPLSNPGRPWRQFNACVEKLQLTCPWLRRRDKQGYIDPPNPGLSLDFSSH